MKIIWAVDAFEDNKEINEKMSAYITHLYEVTEASIEPLYLLRENEIILPTYEVPAWASDHSRTAESLFKEMLTDYNLPFLTAPKVIPHSAQSHAGAAEVLSDYAEYSRADLIVVGSHGRQGFQRFLLGSFAESLLLQSQVPVCVVGHQTLKTGPAKKIIFPTDFGDHSKENFRQTLNLAKKLKAEVLLLHAITRPLDGLFDADIRPHLYAYEGQMLTLEQIVEHQIEHQSQRAQLWLNWAQHEGVIAHFLIDSSFKPIDDLIVESVATHEGDLIVMEAQSGAMSAALLGSYTRNVVRKASCPVYVITRHFYDKAEERFIEASP